MEEIISSSPSFSSVPQEGSVTLDQRLRFILQTPPYSWVYAILWQPWKDSEGRVVLTWGNGHYQGTKDFISKPSVTNPSYFDQNLVDEEMTSQQWFYMLSSTSSFVAGCGAPGRAYSSGSFLWLSGDLDLQWCNCERVKEARTRGIQTLVYVSTPCGVVELGSSHLLKQDLGVVQSVKSLFDIGSNQSSRDYCDDFQVPTPEHRGDVEEDMTAVFDMGSDQSGCGYGYGKSVQAPTLEQHRIDVKKALTAVFGSLSSHSGPSNSDSPLASPPKKRGKKSGTGITGEVFSNHVDTERKRRENLNHRFYTLRSIVPHVSGLDKSSLLGDAVSYINELKSKIKNIDSKLQVVSEEAKVHNKPQTRINHGGISIDVNVKIIGSEALIRVQSPNLNYPSARLMDVLRDLNLKVVYASFSSKDDVVLQDVVVRALNNASIIIGKEAVEMAILERL